MYATIHQIVLFLQILIKQAWFVTLVRILLLILLIAGAWVATREIDFSGDFSINDKLIHIVVFAGYAVLADLSYKSRSFWLSKGLPLLVYGLCIEIMQYYAPDRSMSLWDWMADFAGILLYYLMMKSFVRMLETRRLFQNLA